MEKLQAWGINAALIGEALMTSPDIAAKMKELFDLGKNLWHFGYSLCGRRL